MRTPKPGLHGIMALVVCVVDVGDVCNGDVSEMPVLSHAAFLRVSGTHMPTYITRCCCCCCLNLPPYNRNLHQGEGGSGRPGF